MRSFVQASCIACGAPLTVLPLGTLPGCAICGPIASHQFSNGRRDETASSDARVVEDRRDATEQDA
jgi:hypothetical protein